MLYAKSTPNAVPASLGRLNTTPQAAQAEKLAPRPLATESLPAFTLESESVGFDLSSLDRLADESAPAAAASQKPSIKSFIDPAVWKRPGTSAPVINSSHTAIDSPKTSTQTETEHPQPLWSDEEDDEIYGRKRKEEDQPYDPEGAISPLFALGAFGIATAIVLGTAGVVAVIIARTLDVRDVSIECCGG